MLLVICSVETPDATAQSNLDFMNLSLEELLNVRITSVSRNQHPLLRTPAAVFVLTPDDIRRSGATDVADLLRMVPGVNVAQVTSSVWAISARGFNAQYATKLLVLVDGRTAYDPAFSGVFWHLQNLDVEDIERIEVIRGPGATMWGANAVNGVISITTKNAVDTQGGRVVAGAGGGRPGEGAVRFGGSLGSRAYYRVFARQTTRSSLSTRDGQGGGDAWNGTDFGFRVDWEPSTRDGITIQGGGYRGVTGSNELILQSLAPPRYGVAGRSGNEGAHVLARWNRSLANESGLALQVYLDDRSHTHYGAKDLDVLDVDLQHTLRLGGRHGVVWGAGYRESRDHIVDTLAFGLSPARATVRLASAFVQDEITVVPHTLFVTAGSKFEHSTFTGANVQPAVRIVWQPTERQSVWASSARAVRTANRVERGMHLNVGTFQAGPLSGLVELLGHEQTRSEELTAHEAGYRYQANRRLWFDVALFHNRYDHLSVLEPGESFLRFTAAAPQVVVPIYFQNNGRGNTYGAEVTAQYQASDAVLVKGSYSRLRMQLESATIGTIAEIEGQSPQHQGHVGATLKLPRRFEVSSHLYMVGALPSFQVPSYSRADMNVEWNARKRFGMRVVGQNLLGSHLEFGALPTPANPVRRSVRAELQFSF